jgi:hypothetical protein
MSPEIHNQYSEVMGLLYGGMLDFEPPCARVN